MAEPGRRHSFAAALALRLREALRRPVVRTFFLLQALIVLVWGFVTAVEAGRPGAAQEDYLLHGLAILAAPGGLVFGVLAAIVVGADFTWATERVLLARDPRRTRLVRLHLALVVLLGLLWVLAQGLVAVAAGYGLEALTASQSGSWRPALPDWAPLGWHLAALTAATLAYGLLGAACALVFRGGLAGVVALLVYGLLGELVLAPRWEQAETWTLYVSATRLAAGEVAPQQRAATVLGAAAVLALLASHFAYAGRELRS